jgi:tetratricopeptide (TPR) repeat protein
LNNDNTLEKFYCKEKIYCLFGLKKHLELIQYFKSVYNLVDNDSDVMLKVGLSLHALGKFKESEYLLEKIPDKVNLPSFEERKKEFTGIISNIKSLEKKENLSFDELKDLGFAYLFNSDYAKAEEIFRKASFAIE